MVFVCERSLTRVLVVNVCSSCLHRQGDLRATRASGMNLATSPGPLWRYGPGAVRAEVQSPPDQWCSAAQDLLRHLHIESQLDCRAPTLYIRQRPITHGLRRHHGMEVRRTGRRHHILLISGIHRADWGQTLHDQVHWRYCLFLNDGYNDSPRATRLRE